MDTCYLLVDVQEIRIQPYFCIKQDDYFFHFFLDTLYFYGKQQPNSLVVHPDFILTTVFDIFAGMWKCSVKSGDIRVGIT